MFLLFYVITLLYLDGVFKKGLEFSNGYCNVFVFLILVVISVWVLQILVGFVTGCNFLFLFFCF